MLMELDDKQHEISAHALLDVQTESCSKASRNSSRLGIPEISETCNFLNSLILNSPSVLN